jgi:hypothetical protein
MCEPVSDTSRSVGTSPQALEPCGRPGRVDPPRWRRSPDSRPADPGRSGVAGRRFSMRPRRVRALRTTPPLSNADRRRGGCRRGPVEDPARRHLDERSLEEEGQGDACLEEVTDRRLFFSRSAGALPAAVGSSWMTRARPDCARSRRRRPTFGVIETETLLPRMCSSLRPEQRRLREVDPLAVPQRMSGQVTDDRRRR